MCYSGGRENESDANTAYKPFNAGKEVRRLFQKHECLFRAKEGNFLTMAHYVMSDIHGEADRFHAMLEKIQFSPEDMLYILGDVVDRGPDGIGLLKEIMGMPNATMLLGNHEHMMLQYMSPSASETDIRRWNRNGNAPTLAAYRCMDDAEQQKILSYLRTLPTHLEIEVNGKKFYLVHGFPGANTHDEVWSRPTMETPNPVPGYQLIIGHTPVQYLIADEQEQIRFEMEVESNGDHLRVAHTPGFIDIDCGCGHNTPIKALACIRLEDMTEAYV